MSKKSAPLVAALGLVIALAGCSGGPAANTDAKLDPRPYAVTACRAVDGSSHAELMPDGGAQFNAQATDRQAAAEALAKASAGDSSYTELSTKISALAAESTKLASAYQTDPNAFAQELVGGVDSPAVVTLVEARQKCLSMGLATK